MCGLKPFPSSKNASCFFPNECPNDGCMRCSHDVAVFLFLEEVICLLHSVVLWQVKEASCRRRLRRL